jgi:hypothetical protein
VAQQLSERIDKWDYMKLKSFKRTKEIVSKLKKLPTEWKKCLPVTHLTRIDNHIYWELKNEAPQNSMTQ